MGCLLAAPAIAQATPLLTVTPGFPASVAVGDNDVSASLLLTNANSSPDGPLTLCNANDGGTCTGSSKGITLVPSCGLRDFTLACDVTGFDPGVLRVDSPATGRTGTSCAGRSFTATVSDPTTGLVAFRPQGLPANVVLPAPGDTCRIDFTFDVLAFPTKDSQPAPGLQTAQVAEELAYSDHGLTFARSPSNDMTVRGAPTIASTASPGVVVGGSVSDAIALTGEYNPALGDVTFELYGPADATCSAPPVFSPTVAIAGDGTATSGSFTPASAGTYRWIARYGGDAANDPAVSACGAPNSTVTVAKASPVMSTSATPSAAIGAPISDTATLTAKHAPTLGTVTFRAYGPADVACSGTPAFATTVDIATDGTAASGAFTPTTAGTYRWIAGYGGDADNNAANGACNDAGETVTMTKASPTIASAASGAIVIGASVSDSATLTGEYNPAGGNVAFNLYGPGDGSCAATPAFTATVAVDAAGTASSPSFTPTAPGTYRWIASYGGDVDNNATSGACNDLGSSVTVAMRTPTLQTDASPAIVIGATVTATATLTGELNPANGNVTFNLYGPADGTCAGTPAVTQIVAVAGAGTATTAAFTPTATGTYRWTASYGGDANNTAAQTACDAAGANVVVSKATPSIAADASAGVTIGGAVSAGAALSAAHLPAGGTVTFDLYQPGDSGCTGSPAYTHTVTVAAGGTATSATFTPQAPGTYRWVATYAGDGANGAAGSACADPGAAVTVSKTSPSIAVSASPSIVIGATIRGSATLTGEQNPAHGNVTFRAFGPADPGCTATAAFTSTGAIAADGTATSADFTPASAGTYRWIAAYGGDAANGAVTGTCAGSVTVAKASPEIRTNASPAVAIGAAVSDSATLTGGSAAMAGTVTFRLYGPGDATCSTTPAFVASVAIAADATAASPSFTPTIAGTYRWTASYGGDANDNASDGPCNAPGETVVAGKASPSIATKPSAGVMLGGAISDTASLDREYGPVAGKVTFSLYGPDDATCARAAIYTSTVAISGAGTATADPFAPTTAGTYRWVAIYGGDANNGAAIAACDATAVEVQLQASPLLCGDSQVALVDVFPEGRRMIISGAARPSLQGQRVKIVLASSGKTVVTAKISKTGAFAATAPLPPKRIRGTARYAAVVGTRRSIALKLQRRSYLTKAVVRGARLTLAGRVTGRFKVGAPVSIVQITLCTKRKVIAKAKLSKKGTWRATVPAPDDARSLLFRAGTTVRNGARSEKTFTLPAPATTSALG